MAETCPHCGIKLPAMVDAFCPECRNDLAEAPSQETSALARPAARNPLVEAAEWWHTVKAGAVTLGTVVAVAVEYPSVAIAVGASVAAIVVAEAARRRLRANRLRRRDAAEQESASDGESSN
jgi:hypothetical protein